MDADELAKGRTRLRAVKRDVERWLGAPPADVAREAAKYKRELQAPYDRSSKADLIAAIREASIVFGGDFHAFAQAQRTHLKLLRALPTEMPVTLAFECLPAARQSVIDRYQKRELNTDEFRRKIRWDQSWGFPWKNYEPLFSLAQNRGWKILGLGVGDKGSQSLDERDRFAARRLVKTHERAPEELIYVLFGELHLCESNLPRAFATLAKSKRVKIHLNPERVYFQLAEKGLEHETDVVRFKNGNFGVLVSPPWVQWQNYLLFLEAQIGAGRSIDEDNDLTDSLARLIKMGDDEFGLQTNLDEFALATSRHLKSLKRKMQELPLQFREIVRQKRKDGRSFYIPKYKRGGEAYLGVLSLNHLALLAGHIIYAGCAELKQPLWRGRRDFEPLIWSEAFAYFFSKLINHKRQTESIYDLQSRFDALSKSSIQKDALKIALLQSFNELLLSQGQKPRPIRYRPRQTSSWAEAARIVGEMTGEKLYIAYRSRRLLKQDVIRLIQLNPVSAEFAEFFREMMRFLAANPTVPKSRSERL